MLKKKAGLRFLSSDPVAPFLLPLVYFSSNPSCSLLFPFIVWSLAASYTVSIVFRNETKVCIGTLSFCMNHCGAHRPTRKIRSVQVQASACWSPFLYVVQATPRMDQLCKRLYHVDIAWHQYHFLYTAILY